MAILLELAVRDLWDEWATAACLVIGVAAAAAPLLLLLAIRAGVIEQMRAELTRYPSSRELISIGQPVVEWRMVEGLRRQPEVAFVMPRTRLLAASAILQARGQRISLDLVPSGPGDPLAPASTPATVAISEPVARALGVSAGEQAELVIGRTRPDGERESVVLKLRISNVLPARDSGRQLALVDTNLLVATEIYREQEQVRDFIEARTLAEETRNSRRYAGLRVYARSVDDLAKVRSMLLALGIETDSRIEEVRLVQRLDRALAAIIAVIASVAAFGMALSLAAAQWGWVERRRADLGYLRLIGLERADLMLLPVTIGLIVTIGGVALAGVLGLVGQVVVNRLFAGVLGGLAEVSALSVNHVAIVGALAAVVSLFASIFGSIAARRIGPAVAIRGQ